MSDISPTVLRDVFWLLCGRELGRGAARIVYATKAFDEAVIKIEDGGGSFQNIIEWETWQVVKGTELERWFAPCIDISSCGTALIQARTVQPRNYPKQLPIFLTDTKRSNYGLYKGRFVCHDYGLHMLWEFGMSKRAKKAHWVD